MDTSTVLIMHDTLDPLLPLNEPMWSDLTAAFDIPHVYKVGGNQESGFVQFGPEHTVPDKKVCLMTPSEAAVAGIATTELGSYTHPTEACYVFGPDNTTKGWESGFADPTTDYVHINTPSGTELYSFSVASMVLWHRNFC